MGNSGSVFVPGVELTLRDECVTGGRYQVVETLCKKISAYSRWDRKVRKIYIGIASGPDALSALWRRYDYYKQENGINEMIAVYRSSSENNCKIIEYMLEEYYRGYTINRAPGGGGRPTSQYYKYVYLAIKRLG